MSGPLSPWRFPDGRPPGRCRPGSDGGPRAAPGRQTERRPPPWRPRPTVPVDLLAVQAQWFAGADNVIGPRRTLADHPGCDRTPDQPEQDKAGEEQTQLRPRCRGTENCPSSGRVPIAGRGGSPTAVTAVPAYPAADGMTHAQRPRSLHPPSQLVIMHGSAYRQNHSQFGAPYGPSHHRRRDERRPTNRSPGRDREARRGGACVCWRGCVRRTLSWRLA